MSDESFDDGSENDLNCHFNDTTALCNLRLSEIEQQVLGLRTDLSADQVAERLELVARLTQWAKAMRKRLEELLICWIDANGDLTIGNNRYYVAPQRVTVCRDLVAAAALLLDACGGDLQQFCGFFRNQPLKYGACKGVLTAEQYQRVFTVQETRELRNGPPLRRVRRIDTRFLR